MKKISIESRYLSWWCCWWFIVPSVCHPPKRVQVWCQAAQRQLPNPAHVATPADLRCQQARGRSAGRLCSSPLSGRPYFWTQGAVFWFCPHSKPWRPAGCQPAMSLLQAGDSFCQGSLKWRKNCPKWYPRKRNGIPARVTNPTATVGRVCHHVLFNGGIGSLQAPK